jgi:hypothetical protein
MSSPGPLVVVPIISSAPILVCLMGCSRTGGAGAGGVAGRITAFGSLAIDFEAAPIVVESPVPFLNSLNLSCVRVLFSSRPPMTHVRLSWVLPPFLCNRLTSADSRSGKTGISSHIVASSSSPSARRAKARYSHARCCSSASRTWVYRSKMLMRCSLISGNRLTHCSLATHESKTYFNICREQESPGRGSTLVDFRV